MSLTPEQLMIPRVMAIGTEPGKPIWPDSSLNTGDVLIRIETANVGFIYVSQKEADDPISEGVFDPENYPNCFRSMPWWESRKPEEMPLYLKCGENGKVRKVARYFNWATMIVEFEGGRTRQLTDKWIPCTEDDFIQYQNSKK